MFKRTPSLPHDDADAVVLLCANTTWYVVNFRARLMEALRRDGWRVVVFSPTDRHVARLQAMGVEHVPMDLDNASTDPVRELRTLASARRVLARVRPRVVLTWTPKVNIYVSLAARSLGCPVIANISGLGRAFASGGWLQSVARLLYRAALRWPATVFFQNDDDLRTFVDAGLVEASRTARLPGSGVDVERFAPPARRRPGGVRFLFVARLIWDKGVGEYVEAARIVRAVRPDASFAIAGFLDGSGASAVPARTLEGWVAEGLVEYLGAVDDMVPVYAGSDCVVLPSYYREGVPRSLLEAASMALPIITTDSVGCRETVVDGVTGWLVTPRDARDLADRMLAFVDCPAPVRESMGRAARERVLREFDERIVIGRYRTALAAYRPVAVPVGAVTAASTGASTSR